MRKRAPVPVVPHPFQKRAKMLGIMLTELREALQGYWDEVEISMMLSGVDRMPASVESVIEEYLDFVKDCRAYDEIGDEVSNIVWGEIR